MSPLARLLIFYAVFIGAMTVSGVAFPVYAQESDALAQFAVFTGVMAGTGALGFLPALASRRFDIRTVLASSLILYSSGVVFRLFVESWTIAIVGGALAGIGAGAVLALTRPWLVEITSEDSRPRALSLRETVAQTVGLLSPLVLSALILVTEDQRKASGLSLVVSASLLVISVTLLPRSRITTEEIDGGGRTTTTATAMARLPRAMGSAIFALGALGGVYTAMFNPYLVLILLDTSVSLVVAPILVSVLVITRTAYVLVLGRRPPSNEYHRFLGHEGAIGVLTILAAFAAPVLAVILLACRATAAGGSVFYEELFQAKWFDRRHLTSLFALSQSGFLGGSTVGAGIAGFVYIRHGGDGLLLVSGILTLLTVPVYVWVVARYSRGRTSIAVTPAE